MHFAMWVNHAGQDIVHDGLRPESELAAADGILRNTISALGTLLVLRDHMRYLVLADELYDHAHIAGISEVPAIHPPQFGPFLRLVLSPSRSSPSDNRCPLRRRLISRTRRNVPPRLRARVAPAASVCATLSFRRVGLYNARPTLTYESMSDCLLSLAPCREGK
jgi:hypothetical protein